jgi:hypothetical protein
MAVNDALLWQHAMIGFLVKENSCAACIFDELCHVYGDSVWVPAVCDFGWKTSKMATRTLSLCLTTVDQEPPPQNATCRKLVRSLQKAVGWWLGKSWHHLALDTVGDDKDFGILGSLLCSLSVGRRAYKGTHGYFFIGAPMTLPRAVISYLTLSLAMKTGSTILILKQDDRVWNGIMLHLQIRRPEPYPWPETWWDQFSGMLRGDCWLIFWPESKLSVQFTTFSCSRNCSVHFVTSVQWKDTTFFNKIVHTLTLYTWHWAKLKNLARKCIPILQSRLGCFLLPPVQARKRSLEGTAVWKLQNTEKDFCNSSIFKLVQGWQKYLDHSWDSVE